jgi:hypothetical protein
VTIAATRDTLTAVARDAAGKTTSTSIAVTVANELFLFGQ